MADDSRKRNTDCVYFLASPATCKKGSDCEYRHSYVARHNLKDCWYWLNGNCIHPSCPFRHPPLDVSSETSQFVHLSTQAPIPVSKINAPCHFYFNGYCNKGINCSFLHDLSTEELSAQESFKTTRAIDAHLAGNKISDGIGNCLVSAETADNVLKRTNVAMVDEQSPLEDPLAIETVNDDTNYSPVPHDPTRQCELAKGHLLVGSLAENSDLSSDEEPMTTNEVDKEERGESSPGFDVLVDDGSDQLGFEDEAGYLSVHDSEKGNGIGSHLLPYDYEEPVNSNHVDYQTDTGTFYEQNGGINDYYNCWVENDLTSDYVKKVEQQYREGFLEPRRIFHKRKSMPPVESEDLYDTVDIREQPRKYRRTHHRLSSHHTRRHSLSRINNEGRVGGHLPVRSGGLHRMSCTRRFRSKHECRISGHHRMKPRKWHGRWRVQRGTAQFTGPMPAKEFDGPKSLSELLKDKNRLGSTSNDTSKSAQQDSQKTGGVGSQRTDDDSFKDDNEGGNGENNIDNGCHYDDEDDVSEFEKKLSALVH
ncbi:zinc finger CCCH domain-containing protein 34-like [Aristolochia californica]|uniref:zinc finger CCCH domain-containing protein 34-like n=1 Tax=Aristolochia californica TaxID=171875 RepID=UPI0035D9636D